MILQQVAAKRHNDLRSGIRGRRGFALVACLTLLVLLVLLVIVAVGMLGLASSTLRTSIIYNSDSANARTLVNIANYFERHRKTRTIELSRI